MTISKKTWAEFKEFLSFPIVSFKMLFGMLVIHYLLFYSYFNLGESPNSTIGAWNIMLYGLMLTAVNIASLKQGETFEFRLIKNKRGLTWIRFLNSYSMYLLGVSYGFLQFGLFITVFAIQIGIILFVEEYDKLLRGEYYDRISVVIMPTIAVIFGAICLAYLVATSAGIL